MQKILFKGGEHFFFRKLNEPSDFETWVGIKEVSRTANPWCISTDLWDLCSSEEVTGSKKNKGEIPVWIID